MAGCWAKVEAAWGVLGSADAQGGGLGQGSCLSGTPGLWESGKGPGWGRLAGN